MKSTVLKAGHHGFNTSSSATFLAAVKPATAILSYKENNSYGHSHDEVIQQLNAVATNGQTHIVLAKPWTNTVTPKPEPKPQPDLSSGLYVIPGAPTKFANCTEMRNVYPYGVRVGHPAYNSKHDRDKDGWACE